MEPDRYGTVTLDDERFGPVTVTTPRATPGRVSVRGPRLPATTIVRSDGAPDHGQAPIGTRDAARLTMTVGERTARLKPGSGRLRKSSFRVTVETAGLAYSYEVRDKSSSVLRRDGRRVAVFIWTRDSESAAHWSPDPDTPLRVEDAAVGYALMAAFGTGAAGWPGLIGNALSDAFDAFL
ncbi:hypothetical protein [Streptomyces sp. NPDC053048]|uniref:hypothetical protein n=1 Tax=Streptomyces sp. NPDC053048 TaxID=3365694 RepID=UPI0037D2CA8A